MNNIHSPVSPTACMQGRSFTHARVDKKRPIAHVPAFSTRNPNFHGFSHFLVEFNILLSPIFPPVIIVVIIIIIKFIICLYNLVTHANMIYFKNIKELGLEI